MTRIIRTYRISPLSALKLKMLSATMKVPMSRLIDIMINDLWEQEENQVTTVTEQLVSQESQKILKRVIKD